MAAGSNRSGVRRLGEGVEEEDSSSDSRQRRAPAELGRGEAVRRLGHGLALARPAQFGRKFVFKQIPPKKS